MEKKKNFRSGAPRKPQRPPIELTIERLNDEGVGLGHFGGKEVQVAATLPGEKIALSIEHEGQYRIIGNLERVITPHPERRRPPCSHFGQCLGCSLIHLKDQAQLHFKTDRVKQALLAHASLNAVRVHEVWPAATTLGYRTTAKLAMAKDRGKVKIGLYRRGSHTVVDIDDCPLHHPLINRIVQVVKQEVERQGIYVYNPARQRGLLRYLTIRVSPTFDKAMVTFVTSEKNFREVTHLAKGLQKKVPEVVSIHQNINSSAGNVIFGRDTLKMLGAVDLIDQVGDIRLRIAPTSFFQVNNPQAARIYELVRQWTALQAEDTAIDLYCGIGGIAMNLARDAGRVIGIEVVEEAVRNARENAQMNGIQGCSFRAGDAAELVHDLTHEVPAGSVAVVNPPRGGCAPEVLEALVQLKPRTLIYVSCNPDTLARDLDLLAGLGYRTEEIQPVDMFPQTSHVESVARLVPDRDRLPRKKSQLSPL